jgi:hypothetical protein
MDGAMDPHLLRSAQKIVLVILWLGQELLHEVSFISSTHLNKSTHEYVRQ